VISKGLLPKSSIASFQTIEDPIQELDMSLSSISSTTLDPPSPTHQRLTARANRMSRQMTDQEFYTKHINEIVTRDEEIRGLKSLVSLIKSQASITQAKVVIQSYFDGTASESVESVQEMGVSLAQYGKEHEEMEIIVQEQQERIEFLDALVEERGGREEDLRLRLTYQQGRIEELEGVNRGLRMKVEGEGVMFPTRSSSNRSSGEGVPVARLRRSSVKLGDVVS
jgi:hypothetical protein